MKDFMGKWKNIYRRSLGVRES